MFQYIVNGSLLFKFAIDDHGIYGDDDAAASKVAGHELKGLMAYFNCNIPGLCFPLMALVDCRGYRLSCLSLLPVNANTLRYGSSDAGRTVFAADVELNEKIKQGAKILNLKPHR